MTQESRWDALAQRYASDANELVPGADAMWDTVLALIDTTAGQRALDLACGPGQLSRYLAGRGNEVTAVDLSTDLVEHAAALEGSDRLGIRYHCADAADPGLLVGDAFDLVVCSMALSDIDDLGATIDNVARLLAPGGRFVFSILHPLFPGFGTSLPSWPPAGYFDEGRWVPGGHAGYRGVVGATHRTLSTYLNALIAAGFRIDRVAEASPPNVPVPMFLAVRAVLA